MEEFLTKDIISPERFALGVFVVFGNLNGYD